MSGITAVPSRAATDTAPAQIAFDPGLICFLPDGVIRQRCVRSVDAVLVLPAAVRSIDCPTPQSFQECLLRSGPLRYTLRLGAGDRPQGRVDVAGGGSEPHPAP